LPYAPGAKLGTAPATATAQDKIKDKLKGLFK